MGVSKIKIKKRRKEAKSVPMEHKDKTRGAFCSVTVHTVNVTPTQEGVGIIGSTPILQPVVAGICTGNTEGYLGNNVVKETRTRTVEN